MIAALLLFLLSAPWLFSRFRHFLAPAGTSARVTFTGSNFAGSLVCHRDFYPYIVQTNEIARKYGITVIVVSSYRAPGYDITGAIVTPSQISNHEAGCAYDFNLSYLGKLWTSAELKYPVGSVKEFIKDVQAIGVRWGGTFNTPDVVHFDLPINLTDFPRWKVMRSEMAAK